jgi:hypothetical protein
VRVGHRAALPPPPEPEQQGDAADAYDPGAHTVAEVVAYVAEHPDERATVRAAEAAGKARVTLLDALQDDPEA